MKGGWKSETVKEALDLCLACKGCRTECPMNVDMATYKAEFLSHYYEGRLRPRHAYAMGLIYWWARLGSLAPGVVNLVTHLPVVGKAVPDARRDLDAGGPCRRSPPRRSRPGGARRPPGTLGRPSVVLWPDTFNNHFHPQTAKAAVEVLEDARVPGRSSPRQSLCCGRPLYDFGMLDTAKGLLARDPRHAPARDRGEHAGRRPGAELRGRLPRRADRTSSRWTRTPSGSAARHVHPQRIPREEGPAFPAAAAQAQGPGAEALPSRARDEVRRRERGPQEARARLRAPRLGLLRHGRLVRVREPSTTTSRSPSASGGLLPAVRAADADTLVIADGFSCREQIADLTGRGALAPGPGHPDGACARGPTVRGESSPRGVPTPRQVGAGPSLAATAAVAGLGVLPGLGVACALTRGGVDNLTSLEKGDTHAQRAIRHARDKSPGVQASRGGRRQVYARMDEQGQPANLDAIDQDEGKIRAIADRLYRLGFGVMRQRSPRAGKVFYLFKATWPGPGEPPANPFDARERVND